MKAAAHVEGIEQYAPYNFGDGNGQLFFEKDDGGNIKFHFSWSCL